MYGTTIELAEKLNVKRETIYFYSSNAYKQRLDKRKSKNAIIVIKLDED